MFYQRVHGNHGQSGTVEYKTWLNIKQRCSDPNHHSYPDYGGRGITICPEWEHDYLAFLAHVGKRPPGMTIERIENDKGYQPGNVRWAPRVEQNKNRRNVRMLTYNGKTKSVAEWGREVGIGKETIYYRLNQGWSIERALTYKATK